MTRILLSGYEIQPTGQLDQQISSYLQYERSIPSFDCDKTETEHLQSLLLRPGNKLS